MHREDATWESIDEFKVVFLYFDLKDKVTIDIIGTGELIEKGEQQLQARKATNKVVILSSYRPKHIIKD